MSKEKALMQLLQFFQTIIEMLFMCWQLCLFLLFLLIKNVFANHQRTRCNYSGINNIISGEVRKPTMVIDVTTRKVAGDFQNV